MSHLSYPLVSFLVIVAILLTSCGNEEGQAQNGVELDEPYYHLLVFSKTAGWRHDSIEAGHNAMRRLGEEHNANVTITEDAEMFHPDSLGRFDAVVFLNTTETVFNRDQRDAFKAYIQNGGGFVGVHSASDTEYDWPWYGELVGAWFDNHPPGIINADLLVKDTDHPSTRNLPEVWNRDDEWYNFRGFEDHINVLIKLDTDSFEGSDHPGDHPVAWYHEFDGGRVFYTALGHTSESYSERYFLGHLWGGIIYAMGYGD
jgi:uncharacterized protein